MSIQRKDTPRRRKRSIPVIDPTHALLMDRQRKYGQVPASVENFRPVRELKLSEDALLFLRRHVVQEFFSRAQIGNNERRYIESGRYTKDFWVVEHARTYAKAICWAVGEFADVITQAVLSRASQHDISETVRGAVWSEALRFGDDLATVGVWSAWFEKCYFPNVSDPNSTAWTDQDRGTFVERVRYARGLWLQEADRCINLRLLLAGAREKVRRIEPKRREVAKLMVENPSCSDRDLTVKIDSLNAPAYSRQNPPPCPPPGFLKTRLWAEAFEPGRERDAQKMHEYFSKIRKQFSISRPADLPSDK